jgi:TRAP-type transport system periplasmic protein
MKKLSILLVLIFSVSLAFSLEMKLGHYGAEDHPSQEAAKMFADAVAKRTNGQITISIYPNNALGAPPEVLEQNILGAIDMSLPSQGQLSKYSQKFGCVGIPFAFKNYAQADKVLDGDFIRWAAPDLEKAGLVYLSNWEWGFRNLTTGKKQVNKPEDVRGLKIRTPPELSNQATIEALGGIVQTIAFPELQMALKQGVVDGEENPIGVIYSNKIYESQKYLTIINYNYGSMVHVMSKKVFDKLTKEQQKIIKEESKRAGDFMRKKCRDLETKQIEELKKLGMVVSYPDISKFKAQMGPAYEKMKASVGVDNFNQFMKLVDKVK